MTQLKIYDALKNNPLKVIYPKLIKEYNPLDIELVMIMMDFSDEIKKEYKEKRLDKNFRNKVLNLYNRKCLITSYEEEECEVAHILPFCECSSSQKYDIYNGLILSANLHKLFDKYIFSINPETLMIEVKGDHRIKKYHGLKLNLNKECLPYLKMHYNKFKAN